ncbi:MAG TPA: tetratricopeptide repeat protein [Alphaproteobacteria bacterium]|nr:tetratricopeptide repeat protein [Alphaproteobacteria bacterium]
MSEAAESAEALAQLCMELRRLGREQEAVNAASQALKLDPSRADMWDSIGFMLLQRGRWKDASHYLQQAKDLAPKDATIRSHYAISLAEQDDFAGAYKEAQHALRDEPDNAVALYTMGEILCRTGHYDRAATFYKKMRSTGKMVQSATFGEGFARFTSGELDRGMELLIESDPAREKRESEWNGKTDKNLHLVLYGEYGYGDIMQFARYIRPLQNRVGKITLSLPYALVSLMRDSFPDLAIHVYHVPEGAILPENVSVDWPTDAGAFCPYMALAKLGGSFDAMPSEVPYLKADAARVKEWQERLKDIPHPRIGIVWSGNPRNQNNHNRSVPFTALQPLIDLAKPHLVFMQWGDEVSAKNAGIFDAALFIKNFADSAAAMEALDLVITVCSAPAHLAGAMGKPEWIMLAYNPDWRWLIGREDSIWYPSARLFRAPQPKAWGDVVNKICSDIKKLLDGDNSVLWSEIFNGPALKCHPLAIIMNDEAGALNGTS